MTAMHDALSFHTLLPNLLGTQLLADEAGPSSDIAVPVTVPELIIAPAVTYAQLRACSSLVRRMYTWRGYRLARDSYRGGNLDLTDKPCEPKRGHGHR